MPQPTSLNQYYIEQLYRAARQYDFWSAARLNLAESAERRRSLQLVSGKLEDNL
jgi:hypothetical protein